MYREIPHSTVTMSLGRIRMIGSEIDAFGGKSRNKDIMKPRIEYSNRNKTQEYANLLLLAINAIHGDGVIHKVSS